MGRKGEKKQKRDDLKKVNDSKKEDTRDKVLENEISSKKSLSKDEMQHEELNIVEANSSEDVSGSEEISAGEEQSISDDEDISESESASEDADEEAEDEDLPQAKKRKKNRDDGSESFANAFNAILGSHLKAYDRKDPILARNKSVQKKLESDKLELKAKRLLLTEKKQLRDKHHIENVLPSAEEPEKVREIIERERKMKKIAQKGVVRLFNAVIATQVQSGKQLGQSKGLGETLKEELMNEMSKERFLDLVQAAGKS